MKKNQVKRSVAVVAIMFLALLNPSRIMAQQKIADKELIGVWIMTSMKYQGESKNYINDFYNQVKVYRANGEYACAEILKDKNSETYIILPHEYGSYYFKNGKYIEMGREASGALKLTSKTTFKGRWRNRYDEWKKVVDMPEALTQHIVDKCKAAQVSPDNLQKMMKKYIFAK